MKLATELREIATWVRAVYLAPAIEKRLRAIAAEVEAMEAEAAPLPPFEFEKFIPDAADKRRDRE